MKFHIPPFDLLKSDVKFKIVKFLLAHEAPMSEREIASILDVSHMSLNRTMQELAELNLVNYVVVGRAHLWKVNRTSYAYRMFGRLIKNVEAAVNPLGELKRILLVNLPLKLIKRVVIFGSVSKNLEKPNSDIDVFILTKNTETLKKVEEAVEKLSHKCLEIFGNRLSPYILTEQQYARSLRLVVLKEIDQGIQIYGTVLAVSTNRADFIKRKLKDDSKI